MHYMWSGNLDVHRFFSVILKTQTYEAYRNIFLPSRVFFVWSAFCSSNWINYFFIDLNIPVFLVVICRKYCLLYVWLRLTVTGGAYVQRSVKDYDILFYYIWKHIGQTAPGFIVILESILCFAKCMDCKENTFSHTHHLHICRNIF